MGERSLIKSIGTIHGEMDKRVESRRYEKDLKFLLETGQVRNSTAMKRIMSGELLPPLEPRIPLHDLALQIVKLETPENPTPLAARTLHSATIAIGRVDR